VTTAGAVLFVVLMAGASLSAQGMRGGMETQTSFYARTPFEKQMQHEIRCTCGCGHISIAECRKDPCEVSDKLRGELAALIDQGKTHDQIIQWFVTSYGSEEMLGAPIDKGFNRLAWLFPWAIGTSGAVLVGVAAVKWSKRGIDEDGVQGPRSDDDGAIDARLDDELRNLD
jgi:cytochrome c-type biogenesis protein CcmH/NrfF